jgi:phosphatidylserine/phosphatidylglycerophosphate/cardiolipin synthase-like enzyme
MRCSWLLCAAVLGCATPSSEIQGDVDPLNETPATPRDGAPATSPEVRILVEPGDHGSALIDAIGHAATSIHVTMYLLTDPAVADALVARHRAGVDVRVVLNQHFNASNETNDSAFTQLQAAGIPVVWAPHSFTFTHEKCVVIDGTTAWIMTMNAAKSSLVKNREFLAIDTTPADVAEAEAQFAADFAGQTYTPTGALLMSPTTARPGLVALVRAAQRTLDFEVEELSDKGIVTELCAAANRHVTVRGALSTTSRSQLADQALSDLKACGVTTVSLSHPYLHAKAMVADGARAYVGSANFSATSLDRNRELGLLTETAEAVSTIATTVSADITAGRPL